MKHSFNLRSIFFCCFSFLLIFKHNNTYAQGILNGNQASNENIYINTSQLKNDESYYDYGVKLPILKKEVHSHELSIDGKESNLNNSSIKSKFGEDHFYSTNFSWTYKKIREDKNNLPWSTTLNYGINGNKFLQNKRNNLSFRVMTGHKTAKNMHHYGLALSSNGAFKGIPFPFYVYITQLWKQNLIIGFPFISISGPRQNKINYQISLSPQGASFKNLNKINEKVNLNISWSYLVENYVVDNAQFSAKESLLIEKQIAAAEYKYRFDQLFSIGLSVGKEFGRNYFKGQNIFKKEKKRFDMNSSNFIRAGFGVTF